MTNLPSGWKLVKLQDIASIDSGGGFPESYQGKKNGDYPFAKVGDISKAFNKSFIISNADNYILNSELTALKAKISPKHSIAFAKIGEAIKLNKKVITDREMIFDNNVMVIIGQNDTIFPKYLFYYLYSIPFYSLANITAVPALRKSIISNLQIPLPPLDVQKKIAYVLDKADALRRKRKEAIAKLDELLQSTFLDMFGDPVTNPKGWPVKKLGEVVHKITSGLTPRGGSQVYSNSGILFIRSQNVLMRHLDVNDPTYIHVNIHKEMNRSSVMNNDVLLNITGASIGRVCVYSGQDNMANVNQHVCIIRPNQDKILSLYLMCVLASSSFQSNILKQQSGATREAFNYSQIQVFNICLPPLKEQVAFHNLYLKYNKVRFTMNNTVSSLDNLFNSLIQRAFKGKLEFNDNAFKELEGF